MPFYVIKLQNAANKMKCYSALNNFVNNFPISEEKLGSMTCCDDVM